MRGEAARHLDGIVAPLVIHDLPIEVVAGDPPFSDPVFQQLVDLGDRLVINASDFTDLAGGLKRLAAIRRRLGVGDIAWERLAPWHELTAQFFDAPRFRRFLPNLSRLSIKYAVPDASTSAPDAGSRSPAAGALLYAGWIATRLGVAARRVAGATGGGRDPAVSRGTLRDGGARHRAGADRRRSTGRARLRSDSGAWRDGRRRVHRRPARCRGDVVTNADGMTANLRRIPLEPESETDVLRRQLVLDQRDPVYEDALRAAAILISTQDAAA